MPVNFMIRNLSPTTPFDYTLTLGTSSRYSHSLPPTYRQPRADGTFLFRQFRTRLYRNPHSTRFNRTPLRRSHLSSSFHHEGRSLRRRRVESPRDDGREELDEGWGQARGQDQGEGGRGRTDRSGNWVFGRRVGITLQLALCDVCIRTCKRPRARTRARQWEMEMKLSYNMVCNYTRPSQALLGSIAPQVQLARSQGRRGIGGKECLNYRPSRFLLVTSPCETNARG